MEIGYEKQRIVFTQVQNAVIGLDPKVNYWKEQRMQHIFNINNLKKQINDERKSLLGF